MGCGASTAKPDLVGDEESEIRVKLERAQKLMKLTPEVHELLKRAFRAIDSGAHGRVAVNRTARLATQDSTQLRVCVSWPVVCV